MAILAESGNGLPHFVLIGQCKTCFGQAHNFKLDRYITQHIKVITHEQQHNKFKADANLNTT